MQGVSTVALVITKGPTVYVMQETVRTYRHITVVIGDSQRLQISASIPNYYCWAHTIGTRGSHLLKMQAH